MDATHLDGLYRQHVSALEERTGRVLASQGWDAVVIHSGSLTKKSVYDDQFWPFRACPHFQYWLPLAEPDAVVVVRPGRRPLLVRTAAAGFWEKPAEPESLAFLDAMDETVARDLAAVRDLLGSGRIAFVGEDAARAEAIGVHREQACPPELLGALDALRTRKTPYEVACLAEANQRARVGHEALREAFAGGAASELDLHLLFLRETSQDDAETPYKNIVALGEHAATLHHVAYGRSQQGARAGRDAESLLVDAGATCRGYGADITRTWCRGRSAEASAFAALVAGVEAMQERLAAAVRPGTPFEELHDESHRQVAGVLRDVGVWRGSAEDAVASGVTRAFYPHGLGHTLGLQTHDVGCALRPPRADNPFLRNTSDVAVGQVFTIEPGIYFIDALLDPLRPGERGAKIDWTTVAALAPLGGVRIEDDVHVASPDGVHNLTRAVLPVGGGVCG